MRSYMMRAAHAIYRRTPSPALRAFYYNSFCRLARNRKVVTQVNGVSFDLDLGELIDMGIYLGRYEPDMTAAIERYTFPGAVVFDIGANVGALTLTFARLIGGAGKIYAFEPTDYAFKKLSRNLSLNSFPNVQAFQVALADKNLPQQLINFRSSWRTNGTRSDGDSMVDFQRLDDWCGQHGVARVDLIKIDVDGNEFSVLSGAQEILGRCRPLMYMEAVGPHFEQDATNPFLLLQKLGYRFFNAQTSAEYASVQQLRSQLPAQDWGMTKSINIVAAIELPASLAKKESASCK